MGIGSRQERTEGTSLAEHVYFKGEIVPAAEARVSVFDAGVMHAAGLFETMRTYGGRVMRLGQHIERLNHSAAALSLPITLNVDDVAAAIEALLAANRVRDVRLRLTVTAGAVPRPGEPLPETPTPTTLLTTAPLGKHPAGKYAQGMRVCICPFKEHRQNPIAGHKTLAYLPRLLSMKDAAARGCDESLWFNTDHQLAEGAVCNVFVVHDGRLLTPPLDTPVLPGTVRSAILECARGVGLNCAERAIDINMLLGASEVFLTGSVLEVMPVTSIEKHVVGDGRAGAMARQMQGMYAELVRKECGAYG